jgi:hypothetical protein
MEDLQRQIWTTKGSRFNAYRRLQAQGKLSVRAISFLSAYLIILSLISAFPIAKLLSGQLLTCISLAMAIMLLVMSILEGAKEYSLRAERMHSCAIELSELLGWFKTHLHQAAADDKSPTVLEEVSKRYHEILRKTADNHEPSDFGYLQAQYPQDFNISRPRAIWLKGQWFAKTYSGHLALIWGPPICLIVYLYIQANQ